MGRSTRSKQKTPSPPPPIPRTASKRRASPGTPPEALPHKTRRGNTASVAASNVKDVDNDDGGNCPETSAEKVTRTSSRRTNSPTVKNTASTPIAVTAKCGRSTRKGGSSSSSASPSSSTAPSLHEDDNLSISSSPVSKSSNGSPCIVPTLSRTKSSPAQLDQKSTPRRSGRQNNSATTPTQNCDNSSPASGAKRRSQNTTASSSHGSPNSSLNNSITSVTSNKSVKENKSKPASAGKAQQKRERPVTSSEEESPLPPEGEKSKKTSKAARKKTKKRKVAVENDHSSNSQEDDKIEDGLLPVSEVEIAAEDDKPVKRESTRNGKLMSPEKNGTKSPKSSSEDTENKSCIVPNVAVDENGKTDKSPISTPERRSRRSNTNTLSSPAASANNSPTKTTNRSPKSNRNESAKRRLSNGSATDARSPDKQSSNARSNSNKRLRTSPHVNGVQSKKQSTEEVVTESSDTKYTSSNDRKLCSPTNSLSNKPTTPTRSSRRSKGQVILSNGVEATLKSCSVSISKCPTEGSVFSSKDKTGGSKTEPTQTVKPEIQDDDMVTDVEVMLVSKGLKEKQARDVLSLLTEEHKDCVEVTCAVVRTLVWSLLRHSSKLVHVTSPRCNRLIRQLLDHYCTMDQPHEDKHDLCQECVSWAREQKRTALCQELEVSLMTLYVSTGHWKLAQQTAAALYATTKNMQDKEKTVKACLCLSRCYHALQNNARSRGFITSAKTEALKMYTPPLLQAELDLQSGILQIAEGKDLETAISYLKEAATGSPAPKQRSLALKYLVLGCVLNGRPHDGHKIAHMSPHLQDIDKGVEAMLAIADTTVSVQKFRAAREKYATELELDPVVAPQLDLLYTQMMEKNILKIIMPYDRVQIQHIADVISLERVEVERRLSQMILDGVLSGKLDHRDHCLYLYDAESKDPTYGAAIETIQHLEKTVQALAKKARKLLL